MWEKKATIYMLEVKLSTLMWEKKATIYMLDTEQVVWSIFVASAHKAIVLHKAN